MKPEGAPSASAFSIRRASDTELSHVTALWTELLAYHGERDPALRLRAGMEREIRGLARAMLAERDVAVFLGFAATPCAGPALGLCVARIERAPLLLDEPRRGQISELYVREEARRKGLGTALAQTALAHGRTLGVRRIEVRVSTRNLEGQSFWRALGFADFMDVLDLRL
ncbi:MAG TPA: GNAT family N-acetyltransferase [Myxococcota bacterium]|nr:GNAT family N-acetyltransferase [Myxococcota bacterium]